MTAYILYVIQQISLEYEANKIFVK
jgi:hypothetical protein